VGAALPKSEQRTGLHTVRTAPPAGSRSGKQHMGLVTDVNSTSIRAAVELGCRTMQSVFNADDDRIPFFGSEVLPDARLSFSHAHSESHVPGRHLNALLAAEAILGIQLDEQCVDDHTNAAFFSYSGAVALPLNRDEVGGPLSNFLPHNVREGFHALHALVRYRRSARARELAEASIDVIQRLWTPDGGWDGSLSKTHGIDVGESTFVVGLGRALGPLVKYYRATGYGPALQLASILKEKALEDGFPADGAYQREVLGAHTHSTTCVMSSLAQYADLARDAALMARVKAFYDNGLWEIRDELGWVIESSGDEASPDRGEINNSGDILETALILGSWGHTSAYQDAERILRGHILPAQLRDVSFIDDPPNPGGEDGLRDVAARHFGAFGFPAPYGHKPLDADRVSFNMDIVGGGVASLCEAFAAAVTTGDDGHRVNLWFDHETSDVAVASPYTNDKLSVRVKTPAPLWVRMPDWVAASVTVRGADEKPLRLPGYLLFARPPLDRPLVFEVPLTESTLRLRHRTRTIDVRLNGDAVVAMEDVGASLTFFPPL
jgi:hypothetical protein